MSKWKYKTLINVFFHNTIGVYQVERCLLLAPFQVSILKQNFVLWSDKKMFIFLFFFEFEHTDQHNETRWNKLTL